MPDTIERYEHEIARRTGMGHVIAFGFGRHAIIASLSAAGLGAGDEVILSPLTCKVVPLALLSLGLKPVYSDVSVSTLNLDPQKLEEKISSKTRAVLFQHTYGHTEGIQSTFEITARHNLILVEDCAQCMPLEDAHYSPGHSGECAIFSNNSGKPLSAGSGGVAVTDNAELASRIRALRDRLPQRQKFSEVWLHMDTWLQQYLLRPSLYWTLFDLKRRMSTNYKVRPLTEEITDEITKTAFRPSTRQMRSGLQWLQRMTNIARHRTECCAFYRNALEKNLTVSSPFVPGTEPLYYYPILAENKTELLQRARRQHIEIIPWPISTPIYPVVEESASAIYGYQRGCSPIAESVASRLLGLPTHEKVAPDVCNRIANLLNDEPANPVQA